MAEPIVPKFTKDIRVINAELKMLEGEGCLTLPALFSDTGTVITEWQLTMEERKRVLEQGTIYVVLYSHNGKIPPVNVWGLRESFLGEP